MDKNEYLSNPESGKIKTNIPVYLNRCESQWLTGEKTPEMGKI
jgi:hypothetical protein